MGLINFYYINFSVDGSEIRDYEFAYWWDNENKEEIEDESLVIDAEDFGAGSEVDHFSAVYTEKPEEVALTILDSQPNSVSPGSGTHCSRNLIHWNNGRLGQLFTNF